MVVTLHTARAALLAHLCVTALGDGSPGVSLLRGDSAAGVGAASSVVNLQNINDEGSQQGTWAEWWDAWSMYVYIAVGVYALVSATAMMRFKQDTPQRKAAMTLLCCWKDVISMKSCCFYNCLFSPVVFLFHWFRIYVCEISQIYCIRLYWRTLGLCGKFYSDPDFGPDDKSLGKVGGDSANTAAGKNEDSYIWVRLMDFSRPAGHENPKGPKMHETNMQLFCDQIEAADVLQGALGDCWLEASMAILAEHEGAIEKTFITKEVSPEGRYKVQLFDPQELKWVTITVDDYVPCIASPAAKDGILRDQATGMPSQTYAQCHGKEIWACILEKAFAKFCGSYSKIEAGFTEWGLHVMTGKPAWRFELSEMQSGKNKWKRIDLVCEKDPKDPTDKRYANFRGTQEAHDHDEFFRVLQHYHRNGALCCCGGVKDAGVALGLIQGHAFSILDVCQVSKSAVGGEYFRFVQVRNPWGTGEWTGAWSDSSDLWSKFPHVKSSLSQSDKDDGCYWMQWEDFIQNWGYVGCVDMDVDIFSVTQPLYDDRELTGPLKAFCKGSLQYCCLCHGAKHLIVNHHASSALLEADDIKSTCGIDPSGCYCRACEGHKVSIDQGELKRSKSKKSGCSIQ